MILRVLKQNIPVRIERNKYKPWQKQAKEFFHYYKVVAYDVKTTKKGKTVFYAHHTVEELLTEETLKERGYANLPIGSLHNQSVVDHVLKRLE